MIDSFKIESIENKLLVIIFIVQVSMNLLKMIFCKQTTINNNSRFGILHLHLLIICFQYTNILNYKSKKFYFTFIVIFNQIKNSYSI